MLIVASRSCRAKGESSSASAEACRLLFVVMVLREAAWLAYTRHRALWHADVEAWRLRAYDVVMCVISSRNIGAMRNSWLAAGMKI